MKNIGQIKKLTTKLIKKPTLNHQTQNEKA